LIERGQALGGRGKALGHAGGERSFGGEGEADVGAEEGTGEWVEDGGGDQAFAGAEMEARDGEIDVVGADVVGEAAEGGGVCGVGWLGEQEDGGGVVVGGEAGGGSVVGCGEDPAEAGAVGGVRDEGEGFGGLGGRGIG
jgi:hypothetical protein